MIENLNLGLAQLLHIALIMDMKYTLDIILLKNLMQELDLNFRRSRKDHPRGGSTVRNGNITTFFEAVIDVEKLKALRKKRKMREQPDSSDA